MYYLYFNLHLKDNQRMYQTFVFSTYELAIEYAKYLKSKFPECQLSCDYKESKHLCVEF